MAKATDYSINTPALPVIGGNFGAGVYATFVLVATVPQNLMRRNLSIENLSGGRAVVLIDDGTAATAAAPVNPSLFALEGGGGVGQQGGNWQSSIEKGRIQVFSATATPQIMIREN